MMKSDLKLLAGTLAALSLACTAAREETRPTPPPSPPVAAAPTPPPEPPSTPDEPWRNEKPAPLPTTPKFEPPVPTERKLKNGALVLVAENHTLPLIAIDVVIKTGVNAEPINKAGLAGFNMAMLDEGTKNRKSLEISAQLEDLAAELSGGAGMESSRLHLNCLAETLPQCLEILADVLQNPAYRPEDLERIRGLLLTSLEQKKGVPGVIANDVAGRLLYGDKHPWGQPDGGTPATIKAITRDDLARFHDTWFRPNNAIISVAGDVTADTLLPLLEKNFGAWKAKPLPKLSLPKLPDLTKRVAVVDKASASQSQVWVVGRLFPANHPDAVALRVANFPLGGLFTSRLNLNLREEKAFSYGVGSRITLLGTTGTMTVAGGIIAKDTAPALAEYQKELTRFAGGDITEEELTRAKEAYIRSLPSVLETIDSVSSALGTLPVIGLPLDYYQKLPDRIRAVTLEEANRVARAYIQADKWPAIVVGPQGQFGEKMKELQLGPVEQQPAP